MNLHDAKFWTGHLLMNCMMSSVQLLTSHGIHLLLPPPARNSIAATHPCDAEGIGGDRRCRGRHGGYLATGAPRAAGISGAERRRGPGDGRTSCSGEAEDRGGRAGGGDRWQTGDAEDGAAADTERSADGGGRRRRQAMQRTARRLIRSGALMAEVREQNSFWRRAEAQVWWESDREGDGPCGSCAD
uniref:Uncharacterized protein n=1 Tax=Oryza barthii TaxID=65489 RepID=A0A0D3GXU7_9ORYZ